MLLTEFDAELHDKVTFEAGKTEGRAEGRAEGKAEGRAEGRAEGEVKSLAKLVADGLIPLNVAVSRLNLSEKDFIKQALMLDISIKRQQD